VRKCPFCGGEISHAAVKCRHCGGDLPVAKTKFVYEEVVQAPATDIVSRVLTFVVRLVMGALCWFFGGWALAMGVPRSLAAPFTLTPSEFLVQIDHSFYGIIDTHRFFEYAPVAWAALACGIILFYAAFARLWSET